MLGEELAVGNTRQLSIFGYDAVKAELKFTQNVWFCSNNNNVLFGVSPEVMHNRAQGEIRPGQDERCPINAFVYFTHMRAWHYL